MSLLRPPAKAAPTFMTQWGITRLARIHAPISGRPEVGVSLRSPGTRDRCTRPPSGLALTTVRRSLRPLRGARSGSVLQDLRQEGLRALAVGPAEEVGGGS